MTVQVTVILDGAAEISRSLTRVRSAIGTGFSSSVGQRLSSEGLRIVKKLTPTGSSKFRSEFSRRGFPPFRKQWQAIEVKRQTSAYVAVIRNKATATPEGLVALASVEFGASPHTIQPRGTGYPMIWEERGIRREFLGRQGFGPPGSAIRTSGVTESRRSFRQDNKLIFARTVNHPGNQAFHMVRDARIQIERTAEQILIQYKARIERVFGSIKITVT